VKQLYKDTLVIDIGSRNIHIIECRYFGSKIEILKASITTTPQNCITDGNIDDRLTLKEAIRKVLVDGGFKSKKVIFTAQSTSYITRDLILPYTDGKELEGMVKYEMEQYLPTSSSDYVIQYMLSGESQDDKTKNVKIRAVAMPVSFTEAYLKLTKDLKLKPVSLDIHSNSILKLFSKNLDINGRSYNTDSCAALVDLGYRNTGIYIIAKGNIEFGRLISYGAKDLDAFTISTQDITFDEAEDLRVKGDTPVDKTIIGVWISEIQKVLNYYIGRNTGNKIDKIYLYGGCSKMNGITVDFEQQLSIDTERIDSVGLFDTHRLSGDFQPALLLNAAGAFIRI
jgi:type IV pilus assembly protein PilM